MLCQQPIRRRPAYLQGLPASSQGAIGPSVRCARKERMDLLDKIRVLAVRAMELGFSIDDTPGGTGYPGDTVIDEVLGASEVVINGKPTLMFGSNNYLGLTLHPEVMAA